MNGPAVTTNPADSAARSLNLRLRDTDAHLDQYGPMLVHGTDGVVHLAWGALHPHQADVEPYSRLSPQARLPGLLQEMDEASLDFANASLIRRIEDRFIGFEGHQNLHGTDGSHSFARAMPAGLHRRHDLQVVWLGSRQMWLVMEGGIAWNKPSGSAVARTVELLPRTLLPGGAGWVCLHVQINPEDATYNNPGPASMRLLGLSVEASPDFHPPTRRLAPAGEGMGDWLAFFQGRDTLFPVALVEPPSAARRVPMIRQFAGGSYDFTFFANGSATWPNNIVRPLFAQLAAP